MATAECVPAPTAKVPPGHIVADKAIDLPSGKRAVISGRDLKGRDRREAMLIVNDNSGKYAAGMDITYALLARLTTIDGAQQVYEDMLDLSTRDLDALIEAVKGDPRGVVPEEKKTPVTAAPLPPGSS